jgi:hypothetical protein
MSELWAVTCFFNPARCKRRTQNYRWFREQLITPLITVELTFDGQFALRREDADILIQLDQGDILFQKERLLNIALQRVPSSCKGIAWVDCDVIFSSNDWAARTMEALERFVMVQPFSHRYDLPPDCGPEAIPACDKTCRQSVMAKLAQAEMAGADFEKEHPLSGKPAWGLVWAARNDILRQHGLYDACVFNGGDVAVFCAGFGTMESPFMRRRMNAPSFRHYLEWATPFYDSVRGKVGYIDGRIFHLWHGSMAERRYEWCRRELRDLGFDPFTDIAKTEQGTWRWSSDKPALHARVREYFRSRHDDGQREGGTEFT